MYVFSYYADGSYYAVGCGLPLNDWTSENNLAFETCNRVLDAHYVDGYVTTSKIDDPVQRPFRCTYIDVGGGEVVSAGAKMNMLTVLPWTHLSNIYITHYCFSQLGLRLF